MIDEFGNEIENDMNEAQQAAENAGNDAAQAQDGFEAAYDNAFSDEAQAEPEAVYAAEQDTVTEDAPAEEAPAQEQAAPAYEDVYSSAADDTGIPYAQAEKVEPNPAHGQNPYTQPGYGPYGQPGYAPYGQPGQNPGAGYNSTGYSTQGSYNQGYGQGYNQGAYNQGYNPYPAGGYGVNGVPPTMPPKKKKTGRNIFIALVAICLIFALLVSIFAILFRNRKTHHTSAPDDTFTTEEEREYGHDDTELKLNDSPDSGSARADKDALTPAEIAEKGRKSNVAVLIYSSGTLAKASGQGSGIVMSYDSSGKYCYIITCAHVISEDNISVKVQNENGESYDAEIVGYDEKTDVGVIKVQSNDFEPAEFGDSDALNIGDPVYAVGNPGGVEFFGSFTAGYISAINRPISSEIGYTMKCIQHDAAINPGNSGGMLLNRYGQVVGINSQKIVKTDYEGMSFSIPITSAKVVIDDLIQYGYVKDRAKLSISYASIRNSTQYYMIAQMNNLPQGTLIITGINTDSSLANTEVKKYDLIIAVNGEPLDTANTLLEKVDEGKVGDKMTLTICRVNSNYSVDQFNVEATLVEDKGNTEQVRPIEDPTEPPTTAYNPFDYFFGF